MLLGERFSEERVLTAAAVTDTIGHCKEHVDTPNDCFEYCYKWEVWML